MTRIGCAVLAAGGSSRLGRPKQLEPFRGGTLLGHVVMQACASRCDRVAVIVGAHGDDVARAVERSPVDGRGVDVLMNDGWHEGIASSLRLGATWASNGRFDALVVTLGDQPGLTSAHVDRLVAVATVGGKEAGASTAVASEYEAVRGVPAVFPARFFPALLGLRGDCGAASLLRGEEIAVVSWPEGAVDVDDEAGVARLRAYEASR